VCEVRGTLASFGLINYAAFIAHWGVVGSDKHRCRQFGALQVFTFIGKNYCFAIES
jgi:hypothetical protein